MSTPSTVGGRAATVEVLRCAVVCALADLRAIYTWRTWSFVWLSRILCQVSVFALLGRLTGTPGTVEYLLVGNAVFMVTNATVQVANSTTWERVAGTLPLLVAAPVGAFPVFLGRSVLWLLDGVGLSVLALLLLAPVFGLELHPGPTAVAVAIIVVIGLSSYCFGLWLGALALRAVGVRTLVAGVGGLVLMLVTGVQVPVSFWPAPVRWLAQVLPLTHGLHAVREVLTGGGGVDVLRAVLVEALVGAGWLLAAAVAFARFDRRGRRLGTIEFAE